MAFLKPNPGTGVTVVVADKVATLVTRPGLDHQLPSAEARTRALAESDAFLRRALGL